MQNKRIDIHEENVAGEFAVNDQCIICDLCFEIAPNVFRPSSDRDQSIVYQQPESKTDKALAKEALENCPVDAIEQSYMKI